ncbi:MAG: ABC transporter substrate-binding protein [Holosporaceae bacterium]|jgi:putative ABC transport system substrate-binding protein|nr:ABC transporter substrate-binding protein [Holosporaceae bacterium]
MKRPSPNDVFFSRSRRNAAQGPGILQVCEDPSSGSYEVGDGKDALGSGLMKAALLVIMPLAILLCQSCSQKNDNSVKIGVCKVVEHEAINSVVAGMEDYLRKHRRCRIFVETCQGNMALASQIITKFIGSETDVVVTVGTTPSQSAFQFAKNGKIKLVFGSVTNPGDISVDLAGRNVTGVSNFVDLGPQIRIFKKIQPNLRSMGIIYNTGEANSVSIIKRLRKACEKNGVTLMEQGIARLSEISQAAGRLSGMVDAVFITNDNLALSGISYVVAVCSRSKIPVYVSDVDQVPKGCLAALGPNQYDVGVQVGKMVERIADGEDVNKIAVEYPNVCELHVNLKAAKTLGLVVPKDVIAQAKNVIGE